MNTHEKYRKLSRRLELVAFVIAMILGNIISSAIGIHPQNLISYAMAINFAIVIGTYIPFNILAIKVADHWYDKNVEL